MVKAGTDEQPAKQHRARSPPECRHTLTSPSSSRNFRPHGGSSLSLAPTPSRVGCLSLRGCQRDWRTGQEQLSLADTTWARWPGWRPPRCRANVSCPDVMWQEGHLTSGVFFPKTHNPCPTRRKHSRQTPNQGRATNTWGVLLIAVTGSRAERGPWGSMWPEAWSAGNSNRALLCFSFHKCASVCNFSVNLKLLQKILS